MKKRIWVAALSTLLLSVVAILVWPMNTSTTSVEAAQAPTIKEPVSPVAPHSQISSQKPNIANDEPIDEFNPYESEVLKAQILQIADLYEESAKYPITSQPITNPDDVRVLEPFEETEVETPFPSEDGSAPIRLTAAVDKFQYFLGDTIQTRLKISGAKEGSFTRVMATISGTNGDTPLSVEMNPSDETLTEFTANFDTSIAPANLMSPEMLVKIHITTDDQPLFTTVGFRYATASAILSSISHVRQEGASLVIPLQYNVFQNGYYFARAILEDAQTSRPLIQLQTEGRLVQGNAILELRAHISALRTQGSEGPYVLRSIQTYRGAEVGETFDSPASTSQHIFAIPGAPFSDYDNTAHEDPLTQERVDFLRDLGDIDDKQIKLSVDVTLTDNDTGAI